MSRPYYFSDSSDAVIDVYANPNFKPSSKYSAHPRSTRLGTDISPHRRMGRMTEYHQAIDLSSPTIDYDSIRRYDDDFDLDEMDDYDYEDDNDNDNDNEDIVQKLRQKLNLDDPDKNTDGPRRYADQQKPSYVKEVKQHSTGKGQLLSNQVEEADDEEDDDDGINSYYKSENNRTDNDNLEDSGPNSKKLDSIRPGNGELETIKSENDNSRFDKLDNKKISETVRSDNDKSGTFKSGNERSEYKSHNDRSNVYEPHNKKSAISKSSKKSDTSKSSKKYEYSKNKYPETLRSHSHDQTEEHASKQSTAFNDKTKTNSYSKPTSTESLSIKEHSTSSKNSETCSRSPSSSSSGVIINNDRRYSHVPGTDTGISISSKDNVENQVWENFSEFRERISKLKTEQLQESHYEQHDRTRSDDTILANHPEYNPALSERADSATTSTTLIASAAGNKYRSIGSKSPLAFSQADNTDLSSPAGPENSRDVSASKLPLDLEDFAKDANSLSTSSLSVDNASLESKNLSNSNYDFEDWDSQPPVSSLMSSSTADSQVSETPTRYRDQTQAQQNLNTQPPSVDNLSRQSLAEKHLLEIFQRAKRARDSDILSVLLERVVSDTMLLYNQPGAHEKSIDRVCLSLSDFIVQFMDISQSGPASSMTPAPHQTSSRRSAPWTLPTRRPATSLSNSRPQSIYANNSPSYGSSWLDSPSARPVPPFESSPSVSRPSSSMRHSRRYSTASRIYEQRF